MSSHSMHSMAEVMKQKPQLVEDWGRTCLKSAQEGAMIRLQKAASRELRVLLLYESEEIPEEEKEGKDKGDNRNYDICSTQKRKERMDSLMELHGLTHSTSSALLVLLKTLLDHCTQDRSSQYLTPFLSLTEEQLVFTNEFLRWQMKFVDLDN